MPYYLAPSLNREPDGRVLALETTSLDEFITHLRRLYPRLGVGFSLNYAEDLLVGYLTEPTLSGQVVHGVEGFFIVDDCRQRILETVEALVPSFAPFVLAAKAPRGFNVLGQLRRVLSENGRDKQSLK
jgi:hypothetical protein